MGTSGTSDVGDARFEPWPPDAQVHVEWGPTGARLAAEQGDVVVIVDVLAFSTSVVLAAGRGATVLSYSAAELDEMGGRDAASAALGAEIVAEERGTASARFSLSPASLSTIAPGDRLILTSLNGAACTSAAGAAPLVVIGALTNRTAVAGTVRSILAAGKTTRCTIVACGESWSSVSRGAEGRRPGIEDLMGAGSIVAALADLRRSPEAALAAVTFESTADGILAVLRTCVSGRELIARGFADDVDLAGLVDSSSAVPCWDPAQAARAFTDAPDPGEG